MSMFSFIPDDIIPRLILLLLGMIFFFTVTIVILINKKKMAHEVWVPILAFSVLSVICLFSIAVCTMALFAIGD